MKTLPPQRPQPAPALPDLDALVRVVGHSLGVPVQMLRPHTALYGNVPRFDERAMRRIAAALEYQFGIRLDEQDLLPTHFASIATLALLVGNKLEE